jgi:hypothetical protein
MEEVNNTLKELLEDRNEKEREEAVQRKPRMVLAVSEKT